MKMTEVERLQLKLGSIAFERIDKEHSLYKSKDKRLRQMILREIALLFNEENTIKNRINELTQQVAAKEKQ